MRISCGAIGLALLVVACTGEPGSGNAPTLAATTSIATATTAGPPETSLSPGGIRATTTATPTTTAAPNRELFAAGNGIALTTSSECHGLTAPSADGTVTWSDGERLWESPPNGNVTCLFHLTGTIDSLQWSPDGEVLLVDGQLVVGGEANGTVLPNEVIWRFRSGSGPEFVGIDRTGSILAWPDGAATISPLDSHQELADHPGGHHMAIAGELTGGDTAPTEGIFVVDYEGGAPGILVSAPGATVRDVAFSADGSRLYFIVEREGALHFHSIDAVPSIGSGGAPQLVATTDGQAQSQARISGDRLIEFESVIVHPLDPDVALWTTSDCASDGRRGFQIVTGPQSSVIQALGPAAALGFLGSGATTITVAAVSGPCDGLREVGLMSANLETGDVEATIVADSVIAAAVRSVATDPQHNWQGVAVVPPGS